MVPVTHDDVVRTAAGIQGRTIVEILDLQPGARDLEAVVQLLQNSDEGLIAALQRCGDRINRLAAILRQSEVWPADTNDRQVRRPAGDRSANMSPGNDKPDIPPQSPPEIPLPVAPPDIEPGDPDENPMPPASPPPSTPTEIPAPEQER